MTLSARHLLRRSGTRCRFRSPRSICANAGRVSLGSGAAAETLTRRYCDRVETNNFRPIVAIGDADMDIFLRVERLPRHDEKIVALAHHHCPGGMAANFASAVAMLGTPSAFMGLVGDDAFGRATLADMESRGVDTRSVRVKAGEETFFCVGLLDQSGEKALILAPTTTMSPAPADLDLDAIAGAWLIHLTAHNLATALAAAHHASMHDVLVSVDLELSGIAPEDPRFDLLFTLIDILFVNEHTLCALLGRERSLAESARLVQRRGPSTVVVTRGARGALVAHGDEPIVHVPGFAVPVVDTTGAGDCFAAAFVHSRFRGETPSESLRFAVVAAALAVTDIGARTALPTHSAVLAAMAAATNTSIPKN